MPEANSSLASAAPALMDDPQIQLDINSADPSELETLPGIGPSLAQKIVEYRDEHGLFNSVDELLAVSGIGPAKLDQLRDLIRVD